MDEGRGEKEGAQLLSTIRIEVVIDFKLEIRKHASYKTIIASTSATYCSPLNTARPRSVTSSLVSSLNSDEPLSSDLVTLCEMRPRSRSCCRAVVASWEISAAVTVAGAVATDCCCCCCCCCWTWYSVRLRNSATD